MHAWQGIHVRDHPTDSNNRCELRYPGNSTTPPVSFFQCALLGAVEAGPSPRLRGKPIGQSCRYVRLGSIPAPAGETAFRHHRVLRRWLQSCPTLRHCVLNAFRHHWVLRPRESAEDVPVSKVLNAFRHHRVLRERNLLRRLMLGPVLNAFRHHRVLRASCAPGHAESCHVLNAFRHHRVLR